MWGGGGWPLRKWHFGRDLNGTRQEPRACLEGRAGQAKVVAHPERPRREPPAMARVLRGSHGAGPRCQGQETWRETWREAAGGCIGALATRGEEGGGVAGSVVTLCAHSGVSLNSSSMSGH